MRIRLLVDVHNAGVNTGLAKSYEGRYRQCMNERVPKWNSHGAASCRCATRPVLRTRPGHPVTMVLPSIDELHLVAQRSAQRYDEPPIRDALTSRF